MTTDKLTHFKCPFEIKGERDGNILEIQLLEDPSIRFSLIRKAFETFHTNFDIVGIKFCLPSSLLQRCSSIRYVQELILPYQTDVLAGELDYRVEPFLPYQL